MRSFGYISMMDDIVGYVASIERLMSNGTGTMLLGELSSQVDSNSGSSPPGRRGRPDRHGGFI
jgi:hypothetical protein